MEPVDLKKMFGAYAEQLSKNDSVDEQVATEFVFLREFPEGGIIRTSLETERVDADATVKSQVKTLFICSVCNQVKPAKKIRVVLDCGHFLCPPCSSQILRCGCKKSLCPNCASGWTAPICKECREAL